ncbi:MAG: HlyD family efflux transporter periplasmic adaptor subunit, partial [Nitrospinaceae bacterium]|nr:HlyD family efflux transporter periplasmic adaptor subunit [Nitrospinaceae bacterium]NIR57401.1 HlyD family efflux transporter periplasmic adaptor subunit [Nitrospinaceae bacterium]NIS87853.1 HlyD family efflux transporter periplasmic adaptor subunit [Nitrospinaceae bacterium]NIT84724.1 HlyD family efflux transporter periplasmic adaptor subunit [Nitrospinaceae bacterium]NIU46902.1 HlyD family efflux transporter periplasmic adaptor subunit [Nitrospinaceae bacterium]
MRSSSPNKKESPESGPSDIKLWQLLSEAKTTAEFAETWLALQCRHIPEVGRGVVVLGDPESGDYAPVAYWPEKRKVGSSITSVAEMAMEKKRGVVRGSNKNGKKGESPSVHLGYPFLIGDQLYGVIAITMKSADDDSTLQAMRQLQWGSSWVEVWFRRQFGRKSFAHHGRLSTVLELVASGLENERFHKAAHAVITDMAVHLDCERVSLGFIKRNNTRVVALSHSAKFNKKSNLIRDIGLVMDEAVDQQSTVVYPLIDESSPLINRVHEGLAKAHGDGGVCTVPLHSGGKVFGALTFERKRGLGFDRKEIELCETISQMVGPILQYKRREDRSIATKFFQGTWKMVCGVLGPRHMAWKLALILIGLAAYYFSYATGDYRISANTKLEGAIQRVVVAPMDGYVVRSKARPGDLVRKGQLLFLLEDKDLVVERQKWLSQINQYQGQYRDALANFNRSEIRVLKAQLGQAQAKLELIQKQLDRTRVYSPFDGVVVSGDLSQSLGAPVERGEILFELAPLDQYRVILEVDERDIAEVKAGQQGKLVLSGVVEETLPFVVKKVTPVSEVRE